MNELRECAHRAARFGLPHPDLPLVEESRSWLVAENRVAVLSALQTAFAGLTYEDLVGECVRGSLAAAEGVRAALGCPVYFTLGWIDEGERKRFYFDESHIAQWLREEGRRHTLNLHAWLTLPSMEILDPTLGTGIAAVSGDDSYRGKLLVGHAEQIASNGLLYRPMLVGTALVERMGLLA